MRIHSLSALLVLAAAPCFAQSSVIYSEDFEGQATWQTHGLWAADESPAAAPGGAAYSGSRSLNFNDGVSYAASPRGAAASPAIAVPVGGEVTVRLRCNYQTETTGARWDQRSLLLKVDGAVVERHTFAGTAASGSPARCGAMGTWHSHELRLQVPAGSELVLELEFDAGDPYANDFAGWFVDDVEVLAPAGAPAAAFQRIERTTVDFRQLTTTLELDPSGKARLVRSSPTARYLPIDGQATPAELRALEQAVLAGDLAKVDRVIPDPNTYIVAPTTFQLVVEALAYRAIEGSLGVYGPWAAQVGPVMDALAAIEQRLLQSPAPAGDDHGDTPQTATVLDLDPSAPATAGAIDPAGEVDVFTISEFVIMIFPPPQATYVFETEVVGDMDTVLELYDGSGNLLVSDDDGGDGLGSRVVYTTGAGSALFAKVRHWSASGTGSYSIRASRGASDDHANGPQGASELHVNGAPAPGEIEAGDADFFQLLQAVPKIFPPPTYTYVFEAAPLADMDTVLEVYATDGVTLLASNDDAPGFGLGSRVTLTVQAGTIGYVKVRHYSSSGSGSYMVLAKTTQAP